MKLPLLASIVLIQLLCTIAALGQDSQGTSASSTDGIVSVNLDGHPFTTLNLRDYRRPILYPVFAPGQVRMTRNHPMVEGTEGEAKDHPHHKSIWCGHGLINGVSFWHEEGQIKVDRTKPLRITVDGTDRVTVGFHANYVDKNDKLVCTDTNEIVFQRLASGARAIDWNITIHASEVDLLFGDTKEGMMAIRTHPQLRIDKGATAINSAGVQGKEIWGKKANWLDYSANVDGSHVGVALFDHPRNFRHPTTWHARAYGLVAANPFGLHHFEGKPQGAGDHRLSKGESLQWKYRFVFHEGDAKEAKISELYEDYKSQ